MKILMFGWEFPPYSSGGLGTACYGLTKSMSKRGISVTFVIPKTPEGPAEHVNIRGVFQMDAQMKKMIKLRSVNSIMTPYMTTEEYDEKYKEILMKHGKIDLNELHGDIYGGNLFEEVERYALAAKDVALTEDFDLIHAHDWMTYKAGIIAKEASGKPLVLHIHATEFDRSGGHVNQAVYDIEREGFHKADRIVAVSAFTKSMVVKHYGIDESKVDVVYNGVEQDRADIPFEEHLEGHPVVLFLGRLTLQKGPEYFLKAAKIVLEKIPETKFIMVGSGEMLGQMIELAAELDISKNVLFTGFLRGPDIDKAFSMADLYVMPSVSEPFGITPLESLRNGTPVLISKTSGVSEVLASCLKVDFWDIDEMANKIISVLKFPVLHEALSENGKNEVKTITWDKAAEQLEKSYNKVFR